MDVTTRAARSAQWGPAPRRGAALVTLLLLLPSLPGCPPARDRIARQDVESQQSNVHQMESSLQARQAGVYEQIRELREEQSRLERLIEENARQAKTVGQQVERLRESTREDLEQRDQLQREAARSEAEQFSRVDTRFEALQKGLQTMNDNLMALSTFEKQQEERIAKIQDKFQSQLKVVVDEVGQENQSLTRSITDLRAELEISRQDAVATRQGLVDLQGSMQQIAEQLATAQGKLQELAKRQEAARKAAVARPGQHTVRAGETLTTIAARYGVSVQALMEHNRISDADSIREGQKLTVPEP
jgi:LysM repeat protein